MCSTHSYIVNIETYPSKREPLYTGGNEQQSKSKSNTDEYLRNNDKKSKSTSNKDEYIEKFQNEQKRFNQRVVQWYN